MAVPEFLTDEKWQAYLDLCRMSVSGYKVARPFSSDAVVDTSFWDATRKLAEDPDSATVVILCLVHLAAGYDRD